MNPAYRPMLATLVNAARGPARRAPFDDQRWVFETKWDGFRLIAEKRGLSNCSFVAGDVDLAHLCPFVIES